MSFEECDVFDVGSRQWRICRGEADLSQQKMNAYRAAWGMAPLLTDEVVLDEVDTEAPTPELIFHGQSVSEIEQRKSRYGPGTELLKIYEAAGAPHCDECFEMAQQMNRWGVKECRTRIEEIVADMLPRARAWLKNKAPWIMSLIPDTIEDFGICFKLRLDINKSIDAAELAIAERRQQQELRVRTHVAKGNQGGCCGESKPIRPRQSRAIGPTNRQPLIGQPIDRDRLQSHILYHVMPLAGDTEWVWRRHCQWLREVRNQFNGRLIIGIVTPGQGDAWSYCPSDAVREALSGLDAEFIEAPNDTGTSRHKKQARQGIGEGVLFPKMLGMLKTSDPDHVAFYGHCKGVSRPGSTPESAINLWADAMFETLFRNRDAAITALDTHGVCGPFRMRGGYRDGTPGIGSFWFYSGTFFGIRLADAFNRKWDYVPTHYGCVEQWPRLNFDQATQSACLFFDNVTNLYDEKYWADTVSPAFEKWKEARCTIH